MSAMADARTALAEEGGKLKGKEAELAGTLADLRALRERFALVPWGRTLQSEERELLKRASRQRNKAERYRREHLDAQLRVERLDAEEAEQAAQQIIEARADLAGRIRACARKLGAEGALTEALSIHQDRRGELLYRWGREAYAEAVRLSELLTEWAGLTGRAARLAGRGICNLWSVPDIVELHRWGTGQTPEEPEARPEPLTEDTDDANPVPLEADGAAEGGADGRPDAAPVAAES